MIRKFLSGTIAALVFFQGGYAKEVSQVHRSVTITGGGIIGLLEAYHSYLDAQRKGEVVQITILEKNKKLIETTGCNLVPSLTPDEIMAVVPRGSDLVSFLKLKFNEGNGIRVDDVEGIDSSSSVVKSFIGSVERYEKDEMAHKERTEALLNLGKYSMDLWQKFYLAADEELQEILRESNYKPCLEVAKDEAKLHMGYRIDLIFDDFEAKKKAKRMQISYNNLGYKNSRTLSPLEVLQIDPQLKKFVYEHSYLDARGVLHWEDDAAAIWRPGGCINGGLFIPKFVDYLHRKLNSECHLFQIKYGHEVVGVEFDSSNCISNVLVKTPQGETLQFPQWDTKCLKEFFFAPGEAVGTLRKLGFKEPDYAIFAGPSLRLFIDLPKDRIGKYQTLDHCMEVHQEGIVLAWQAKSYGKKVFIGAAGTKAFYGDKKPDLSQEFAKNRHLLQLNIMNNVYPDLISLALERDTAGKMLCQADLDTLLQKNIAKVWVGARSVAYDGFPTLGALYNRAGVVDNARVTTHLGSGGVSFAFGAISMSRAINQNPELIPPTSMIRDFSDSRR